MHGVGGGGGGGGGGGVKDTLMIFIAYNGVFSFVLDIVSLAIGQRGQSVLVPSFHGHTNNINLCSGRCPRGLV